MFWIVARKCLEKSFEHFKMFLKNLFENISKCSVRLWIEKCVRTTHNVLDNCQKCSSGKSFEYFKIFLNNLFGNILDCSLRTFLNVSEEFVWKHFRMFHWTELHSLLWTHVRKKSYPYEHFRRLSWQILEIDEVTVCASL